MKIKCPSCKASFDIDYKTFKFEKEVECPACRKPIPINEENLNPENPLAKEMMECPKCGQKQPFSDSCINCGIILQKYRKRKIKEIEERIEKLENGGDKKSKRHPIYNKKLLYIFLTTLVVFWLFGVFIHFSETSKEDSFGKNDNFELNSEKNTNAGLASESQQYGFKNIFLGIVLKLHRKNLKIRVFLLAEVKGTLYFGKN